MQAGGGTSGYPSTSAFCAKYKYRRSAWASRRRTPPSSSGARPVEVRHGGGALLGGLSCRASLPTLRADPAEDDLCGADAKAVGRGGRHADVAEVRVEVPHGATPFAHEVMVGVEVRIEPSPSPFRDRALGVSPMAAKSFSVWYTVRSDSVGMSRLTLAYTALRGRVRGCAMQRPEDRLPLRRDLAACPT